MKRREFVGLAAAAIVAPAFAPEVARAATPDLAGLKTRKVGKVDIVYKSPHAKPNGLQAAPQGLWVQDQGAENLVSLVNWADGKVIREFKPDIQAASGVTVDDSGVMWLSSTYSCTTVACSQADGTTIAKYWTPGAGRIYQKAGDPPPINYEPPRPWLATVMPGVARLLNVIKVGLGLLRTHTLRNRKSFRPVPKP